MEHEPMPATVTIHNEVFDIVKPERLLPGMVLKSTAREVFARLGPKQSTLEEQIHTVSLHERGFPVARVLESGEYGNKEWYFIEESLGSKTFSEQFKGAYGEHGHVDSGLFTVYHDVINRYAAAQYDPANRTNVSIEDFLQSAIPDEQVVANYKKLGGNVERYHDAAAKVAHELADYPMGVLQLDLNPFNVLEKGVIDFELVGYGPLGYDVLLCSRWHRWFTSDQTSRYHLNYRLSTQQIAECDDIARKHAAEAGLKDPATVLNAFIVVKSAWGFSSTKAIEDEPESKRAFYEYRAGLLTHCVESYLNDTPIDTSQFPEFRV